MFERFTYPARRVMVEAQQESFRFRHHYIGTEHLLLGLFGESKGVAAQALQQLGVGREAVRDQTVQMIGMGSEPPSGHIPFTPRAKRVMELALQESVQLGQDEIGTGHLLLALIREGDGVGVQILLSLGVDLGSARNQVLELIEAGVTEQRPSRVFDDEIRPIAIPPLGEVDIGSGPAASWALQSALFVLAAIVAVLVGTPDSGLETAGLILLGIGILASVALSAASAPRWLRSAGPLVFAIAALVFVADALTG